MKPRIPRRLGGRDSILVETTRLPAVVGERAAANTTTRRSK
jgi:hypothetical protein